MNDELLVLINNVINKLKEEKPNDRSELDRRYAITITEMEKVLAYYVMFCLKE